MSTQSYREQHFEDHVVESLVQSGYGLQQSTDYDRDLVLIPEEVVAFIRDTQPVEYDRLKRQYGDDIDSRICQRIATVMRTEGALHVVRKGIKDRGVKLRLVYFRPSSGLNPEHAEKHRQNRFAVVRQLKYSKQHEFSLDLALFVNGIPILTAELKNSLTGQFVGQAIKQYRQRDHREPLFRFKRVLAHFAIGNEEAYYTTRLAGDKTFFLPFNRGTPDGGAGNPVNPFGHATAYIWQEVLQKGSLLDLLQNYLHLQRETERVFDPKEGKVVDKEKETLIFPRYHQLDVVRKLLATARDDGPGHSYLVQHSAGSGKSNSIAWLSHGFRQLYRPGPDGDERAFDTIVVVTDRLVLDQQLQQTIKQFEQTAGTVVAIEGTSRELREALETGKDIVVTTIQKFPEISKSMTSLGGQRFAVIIDEAHSSQSGESAKHLKQTLSASLDEAEQVDSDEFDLEDEIVAEIRSRGRQDHISFFAFTATPKEKTLELFGHRSEDGEFVPFHTYSMRQAIEEEFILDVLRNYTTFKRYFKLVKAVEDDREYEKAKAVRALTSYVDLTDHAIERKATICLEHFMSVTARAIQGRGRAMFVTRSRLHAVRYFLKFRELMREMGLPFGALVAFSGTVRDGGIDHTEKSLNNLPPRTSIKDAFKLPEYRLLVVANKFQTGFDEPLLHTMYVDKKLGGVAAVQTLSRLNRTRKGKTETVVLDFVNDPEDIQTAFQKYYQNTVLEEETDPNKLYDLTTRLRGFEIYGGEDVERFACVFFDERQAGELMQPILDRVVGYWKLREENEREDFRGVLQQFIRLYGYVSQLVSFEDVELEKEYAFARHLNKKLPKRTGGGLPVGVTDAVDLDSFRIQQTFDGEIGLEKEDARLKGIPTEVSGVAAEPEMDYLSNIISTLNETYGLDLSDKDRVRLEEIVEEVRSDTSVRAVMTGNNTTSGKRHVFDQVVDQRILDQVHRSVDFYKKLDDPHVKATFKSRLFEELRREFAGV